MRKIIKANGELVELSIWQQSKGYTPTQLGKYFSTKENKLENESWYLHEYLFTILDKLRELANKPIHINSAYRTTAEQIALQKKNEGAVSNSPHTYGLAIDIDTVSHVETLRYVIYLRQIARELNLQIRIGYKQYQNMTPKQTFVHIDVTPEMFGIGKPYEFFPNIPQIFKRSIEW